MGGLAQAPGNYRVGIRGGIYRKEDRYAVNQKEEVE
jgi:hypothetical protein